YPLPQFFYFLTLQFLPRGLRAGLVLLIGILAIIFGVRGVYHAVLEPFLVGAAQSVPEVIYDYRRRGRGPKIVVMGGGNGQAASLRGLKAFTSNLTAIVTVADDGGSSGRLRRDIGILPPGDFRNCIAALANDESLVTRLFRYRFAGGQGLRGHSFGNLFITAMAGVTGSFESALRESSEVLAVQGQVLPSTLETVTLCADVACEEGTPERVYGESEIPKANGRILRVMLDPADPSAYPGAIQAILAAELIVIGPGSLYTSLLPNLLVPEIVQALKAAPAPKVYVCNVATQPGETDHYTAEAHLSALEQHLGKDVIDIVLVNSQVPSGESFGDGTEWVKPDIAAHGSQRLVYANLVDETQAGRHDSHKLARELRAMLR
ncbi:MAG: YvcK family protein, partial [Anaerolineae bacterium]|nr:YvcK family protein [Anaerolineae bacterium]